MKENPKYKEIIITEYKDRTNSTPYIFAFCFPKSGPVLVKGNGIERNYRDSIHEYINKLGPCHYIYVYYGSIREGGKTLGSWYTNVKGYHFREIRNSKGRKVYKFKTPNGDKIMRKIPLRYLKEFDSIPS